MINIRFAAMDHAKKQGFALIITLSLMILLTVIAVGLLTLSSISLRSSNQSDRRTPEIHGS
jgi:Tfp pilus assembly protein PilX